MPVALSTSANSTRINLSGEFDFSSQEELKQVFDQAIAAAPQTIQLDLQKATFIDSSVIRMFLKLNEVAHKNEKSLTLLNCNERI